MISALFHSQWIIYFILLSNNISHLMQKLRLRPSLFSNRSLKFVYKLMNWLMRKTTPFIVFSLTACLWSQYYNCDQYIYSNLNFSEKNFNIKKRKVRASNYILHNREKSVFAQETNKEKLPRRIVLFEKSFHLPLDV